MYLYIPFGTKSHKFTISQVLDKNKKCSRKWKTKKPWFVSNCGCPTLQLMGSQFRRPPVEDLRIFINTTTYLFTVSRPATHLWTSHRITNFHCIYNIMKCKNKQWLLSNGLISSPLAAVEVCKCIIFNGFAGAQRYFGICVIFGMGMLK